MALSMKNLSLGILIFGFMAVALFSFSGSWIAEFGKEYTGHIAGINSGINETLNTMYGQAQTDSSTVEESDIYGGSSDIGVMSAEPFKVLKSNIQLTKLGLNMTAQVSRMGILPNWVFTMLIAAFLLTLTFLALNAIFKRNV